MRDDARGQVEVWPGLEGRPVEDQDPARLLDDGLIRIAEPDRWKS
jgi:hypothetical protein